MRIVITGASGFVGSHLAKRLSADGHELMLVSRRQHADTESTKWIQADLESNYVLLQRIAPFQPQGLVHLAWDGIPDFSEPVCRRNVTNSLALISSIGSLPSITKIVAAGSCWEYGPNTGACAETLPTTPTNWFTWAKLVILEYLRRFSEERGLQWHWARVFFVYGCGQRKQSLIPTILTALRDGNYPSLRSPHQQSDYVFIDDVVDGLARMLSAEVPSGIFNLGSGTTLSVLDVMRQIELLLRGNDVFTAEIGRNAGHPSSDRNFMYADTARSSEVLGWRASTPMRRGLQLILSNAP